MTVATALPALRPACVPAELRGGGREDVALLVASRAAGVLACERFDALPSLLRPGDVVVVNDSATIPAALPARVEGEDAVVHLSSPLRDGRWVVEVRAGDRTRRERPALGSVLALPAGGTLRLLAAHRDSARLVVAALELPEPIGAYLARHGAPIRYGHCPREWPLAVFQTIFARRPGSAEMPSAGRPFSARVLTALRARGVALAAVTLHAGVSSLEWDEPPDGERFRVPAATARLVNAAHERGRRVVAVGTTVVRALESAATPGGAVAAAAGVTELVITPARGLRCVDGLLTGWHEPESSHLWMLEAAAGAGLLEASYREAAALGLQGHELGDAHVILP